MSASIAPLRAPKHRGMTMHRRTLMLPLLAALTLAACGGGGGATTKPGATAAPGGGPPVTTSPGGAATPASGGGALPPPISSGALGKPAADLGGLVGVLGPGDFGAVGIPGAGNPSDNPLSPADHYLVYAGKSGGTGGIEFDIFVGDTAADVQGSCAGSDAGILDPGGIGMTALGPPGADEALLQTGLGNASDGMYAGLCARKGKVWFVLTVPDSPSSQAQLIALAKLVMQRTAALQ
jgi:hypothetical protein